MPYHGRWFTSLEFSSRFSSYFRCFGFSLAYISLFVHSSKKRWRVSFWVEKSVLMGLVVWRGAGGPWVVQCQKMQFCGDSGTKRDLFYARFSLFHAPSPSDTWRRDKIENRADAHARALNPHEPISARGANAHGNLEMTHRITHVIKRKWKSDESKEKNGSLKLRDLI